jgi:ATP-dependent 26S proteasome regulatory subunit
MVVLTTNNIERLPPGFMRHGRIDSIVGITRPDEASTLRLVKHYANAGNIRLNAEDADLLAAIQPIVGQAAATIRECVERSKLAAVRRQPDTEHELGLTAEDIRIAAATMAEHNKFLSDPPPKVNKHPSEVYHESLVAEVTQAIQNVL